MNISDTLREVLGILGKNPAGMSWPSLREAFTKTSDLDLSLVLEFLQSRGHVFMTRHVYRGTQDGFDWAGVYVKPVALEGDLADAVESLRHIASCTDGAGGYTMDASTCVRIASDCISRIMDKVVVKDPSVDQLPTCVRKY